MRAGPQRGTCGGVASHARGHARPSQPIPRRRAVADKEHFPRDKYCGDAVCALAIKVLEEMGVMDELKANGEAHFADAGGFVSPSGICYIGR